MDKEFPFEHFFSVSNKKGASSPHEKSVMTKDVEKPEEFLHKIIQDAKSVPLSNTNKNTLASFPLELNETQEDILSEIESKYINHVENTSSSSFADPCKTFDNFVVGPFNQMTFAAASAVADKPGKNGKYPCLYIYGESGLGKTHILNAVSNKIKHKYPDMAIALTTGIEFMREMIHSIQLNKISEFQKKYSEQIDLLMIDDIHELSGKNKKRTQNEFFHIINELHGGGKQLIFTSDRAPENIEQIEERIKTRLQSGLVMGIQKPDFETRIAILKKKAYELDIFLNEDTYVLIADHINSNICELEGAMIKLSAYKNIMKVELDIDIVRHALGLNPKKTIPSKIFTMESIANVVATYFKIPLPDLKSRHRSKQIVKARQIAIYLSKKNLTSSTLKDIAQFYQKDHSSIIYSIKKVSKEMPSNPTLAGDIKAIERKLSKKNLFPG